MQIKIIASEITTILNGTVVGLLVDWLYESFEKYGSDWWEMMVLDKLSYYDRERIAKGSS